MWAQRLIGPGRFELLDIPQTKPEQLAEGQVLVKLGAAGICGSDVPKFLGRIDPDHPYNGDYGFPIHEVVGEIVESKSPDLRPGQRVVGLAEKSRGLQEYFTNDASMLHVLDTDELSDVHATVIQPVCTIFNALSRLPSVEGKRVAVIGLGPLGVLFTHVAKCVGAKRVIGVDVVDRSDVSLLFGIDELYTQFSRTWAETIRDEERPDIVIEAVGHQQSTLVDAVEGIATWGHIFAFGVPDDDYYAMPFRAMFRKQITLYAGTTVDWRRFLARAERHVLEHRKTFEKYITNILPVKASEEAFRLYSRPAVGRLKVVLSTQ